MQHIKEAFVWIVVVLGLIACVCQALAPSPTLRPSARRWGDIPERELADNRAARRRIASDKRKTK